MKKPTLLLHSCCAPCSSSVIERLSQDFEVTIYYFNPNIYPKAEFERRQNEQIAYAQKLGTKIILGLYPDKFYDNVMQDFADLPEKSPRCYACYEYRIKDTAKIARREGFDFFTTTLSVSPHKNAEWINQIGEKYSCPTCKFLTADFKKQNGYLRSLQLSKINGFYRQDYCGCKMSYDARKNK